MTADECEFEHEGFCVVPPPFYGFVCSDSEMREGFLYCNGQNDLLFTEEEYERMFGEVIKGLK